MVRLLAILAFFLSAPTAPASEVSDRHLAEIVRTTDNLEQLHLSLVMLRFHDPALAIHLADEAVHRLTSLKPSGRLAEDLLTVYTGQLGSVRKSSVMTLDKMVFHDDAKVRLAVAIFLRDHFEASHPSEGFFPARPQGDETALENWQTGWTLDYIGVMPSIIAKLGRNSRYDSDSVVQVISGQAFKKITEAMMNAAKDMHPDPGATKAAMQMRRIRQSLAVTWLDGMAQIARTLKNNPLLNAAENHVGVDCEGKLIVPTYIPPNKTIN